MKNRFISITLLTLISLSSLYANDIASTVIPKEAPKILKMSLKNI